MAINSSRMTLPATFTEVQTPCSTDSCLFTRGSGKPGRDAKKKLNHETRDYGTRNAAYCVVFQHSQSPSIAEYNPLKKALGGSVLCRAEGKGHLVA